MSLTNLISQMQQPQFYPHAVTMPIKIIQTHISYVFLTGEYAYKLKKPVNFGFLDFSTLSKRKHFLGEELRLNKPIASDIYLEVVPISKKDDSYFLGIEGDREPEEYLLKMRQFPQESLLINMFERGELTAEIIKKLGKKVAQFHQQTETNDYIRSFGKTEVINESIAENYQQTQKYIGSVQRERQYQETKEFTESFLQDKKPVFFQRIEQDKIRECHGDLHLKNICWWHDKIQLFDRIEFNEPFRYVDVMYDVAFTVMDLDARKRPDFANIFLNTYLEQTGDWEGVQVLPLYLSRQAYVRAKITSFLLDDPAISEQEKQEATQTASDYYHLAWQYTKLSQGRLILMSGLSGSGKTTRAKKLAPQLNAIHIRSDAVRKHLVGIPLEQQGDGEIYSFDWSQKTYGRLLELGILLAARGFKVILDAKYDRIQWRQPVIQQAEANNIPLQIIHCTAAKEVLRERLAKRTQDISDATPEVLSKQEFEAFSPTEQKYVTNELDLKYI
jgi:aminoglycoside phosphotransferase family enzyme/predicted kinase